MEVIKMYLIQSALIYKNHELGEWRTICISNSGRDVDSIIEAMQKVYPQCEYRYERIK